MHCFHALTDERSELATAATTWLATSSRRKASHTSTERGRTGGKSGGTDERASERTWKLSERASERTDDGRKRHLLMKRAERGGREGGREGGRGRSRRKREGQRGRRARQLSRGRTDDGKETIASVSNQSTDRPTDLYTTYIHVDCGWCSPRAQREEEEEEEKGRRATSGCFFLEIHTYTEEILLPRPHKLPSCTACSVR